MSEQREDMTERDDLPGEVLAAADDAARSVGAEESAAPTGKYGKLLSEEGGVRKLTGMYRNWFLDYASYVILERAVPLLWRIYFPNASWNWRSDPAAYHSYSKRRNPSSYGKTKRAEVLTSALFQTIFLGF